MDGLNLNPDQILNTCGTHPKEEFGTYLSKSILKNKFSVIHQNIRSLNKNFDEFSVLVDEISGVIDVIVFTETFSRENSCLNIDGFQGYHVVRKQRSRSRNSSGGDWRCVCLRERTSFL